MAYVNSTSFPGAQRRVARLPVSKANPDTNPLLLIQNNLIYLKGRTEDSLALPVDRNVERIHAKQQSIVLHPPPFGNTTPPARAPARIDLPFALGGVRYLEGRNSWLSFRVSLVGPAEQLPLPQLRLKQKSTWCRVISGVTLTHKLGQVIDEVRAPYFPIWSDMLAKYYRTEDWRSSAASLGGWREADNDVEPSSLNLSLRNLSEQQVEHLLTTPLSAYGGSLFTDPADPELDYIDAVTTGTAPPINGAEISVGDRILITLETVPRANGVWSVTRTGSDGPTFTFRFERVTAEIPTSAEWGYYTDVFFTITRGNAAGDQYVWDGVKDDPAFENSVLVFVDYTPPPPTRQVEGLIPVNSAVGLPVHIPLDLLSNLFDTDTLQSPLLLSGARMRLTFERDFWQYLTTIDGSRLFWDDESKEGDDYPFLNKYSLQLTDIRLNLTTCALPRHLSNHMNQLSMQGAEMMFQHVHAQHKGFQRSPDVERVTIPSMASANMVWSNIQRVTPAAPRTAFNTYLEQSEASAQREGSERTAMQLQVGKERVPRDLQKYPSAEETTLMTQLSLRSVGVRPSGWFLEDYDGDKIFSSANLSALSLRRSHRLPTSGIAIAPERPLIVYSRIASQAATPGEVLTFVQHDRVLCWKGDQLQILD